MCKPTVGFNRLPRSGFPGPPGDIECGIVRPVNTVLGDFLANAEALPADCLKRVSLDDLHTTPSPPLQSQHGAHHDG